MRVHHGVASGRTSAWRMTAAGRRASSGSTWLSWVLFRWPPPVLPSDTHGPRPSAVTMSHHNKSLFIKGLNEETTQHDLRELFSRYGTVNDIYIPMSYHTRRPRGFAYVAFDSLDEAKRAVRKLDGTIYNGREIKVEHAQGDRKTPHEMREKDGPRNGNRSRRRSFSRDRDRDRGDFSRPRRRSRSPNRPQHRRSSSPAASSRSRSSRTAPADDRFQRLDHRPRDRFPSPGSRSKRRDGGDDDRRRSDQRPSSRERASHHSHRNSDDKNNGSHRSGSREA